jgi:hypothetical protein
MIIDFKLAENNTAVRRVNLLWEANLRGDSEQKSLSLNMGKAFGFVTALE